MVNEITRNQNQNIDAADVTVPQGNIHNRNRERQIAQIREYDRITSYWNESNYVNTRRRERTQTINNIDNYNTGYRIHHIRTIQIPDSHRWNELFGMEILNPTLREYVQASFEYNQDETGTRDFAGQIEVSLIMTENYRPGVHVAIFIIYLTPHRQFQDGHVIQMEFGEGSRTHQIVNRMFDPNQYAVISQATEYNILHFVADDDEMNELIHAYFIDRDLQTIRFEYIEPRNRDERIGDVEQGYYIVGYNHNEHHQWHQDITLYNFNDVYRDMYRNLNVDNHNHNHRADGIGRGPGQGDVRNGENEGRLENNIQIRPPPPINNFQDIYMYYYNVIPYNYQNQDNQDHDNDNDQEEELPAQG